MQFGGPDSRFRAGAALTFCRFEIPGLRCQPAGRLDSQHCHVRLFWQEKSWGVSIVSMLNSAAQFSLGLVDADFQVDSTLSIGPEEVQLWRIDLQAAASDQSRWNRLLSTDEAQRAARFRLDLHRCYFAATRAILRKILAGYLNADPADLTFVYSQKQKPALGGTHAENGLSFNVSHSGDAALIACGLNCKIGVDIEYAGRETDTGAIAARFFSAAEQEQLADLPLSERRDAFFRCWTRKEAYIKATGDGLSLPLRRFDVSLAPASENALIATRPDSREASRWTLRDIRVRPDYAAALCVSGSSWKLIDRCGQETHG